MGRFDEVRHGDSHADSSEGRGLIFFVNGKKISEASPDPEWTLLFYLRDKLNLCGTKLGCGEGGCGACTVMLSKIDRNTNQVKHLAINACLTPVCSVHGTAITTVEGIGSTRARLHPVQERIAKAHGSQCGFCTPGIVMSMYALLRNMSKPTMKDLEVAFQGNLCRCTGYRPIIEGYRTFTKEYECGMGENCCRVNGKVEGNGCISSTDDKLFEPSEFTPFNPTQEPIFPPELRVKDALDKDLLIFTGPRVTWYRPTTLQELLALKTRYPESKILVGNTEIGVEVKFKNVLYPVIIHATSVKELTSVTLLEKGVNCGAAASLSDVENVLQKQVTVLPENESRLYRAILQMFKYFAGKQIRNAASFGGNIMTGSPISDMNPILMAAKVELEVMSLERGVRKVKIDEHFFTGYRKNTVQSDEVLVSLFLPKTAENQHVLAYKQAKRRDDDIAIVNMAISVHFKANTDIIEDITIAFGGMGAVTTIPTKTCQNLKGLRWDDSLIERVGEYLTEELRLPADAPGGVVKYRRCLSLSLFFKAYLTIAQALNATVTDEEKSGADVFKYIPPKSSQLFERPEQSQPDTDPIGRPIVHVSAYKQAAGEAVYVDDIPKYENELHLAFVLSTRAHAKIVSIDETAALKLEGVRAFFSSKDLTELQNKLGTIVKDEEMFASTTVFSQGQTIGVVVADSKQLAAEAAQLVKVDYEDISPVIITIEDAIKYNSFFPGSPRSISKGNIEEALNCSDFIVRGSCRMGGQEHFYLETQAALAVPQDSDELLIYSNTQYPFEIQMQTAHVLSIPASKISSRVKRIGGGFGGKESKTSLVALPVALAAYKLKRPVRCMLERDEDMLMTGGRHPFLFKYTAGCTKSGTITCLDVQCYNNGGYNLDHSLLVMTRTLLHIENCYRIPNVRVTGWVCKTNLPSNTAFRGFGAPQAMFLTENVVRHVAQITGVDCVNVAKQNLYEKDDVTYFNQKLENFTIRRCWDECIIQSDFYGQQKQIKEFNKNNRWRKRGISILPTKYGIGFTALYLNKGTALVHIYVDGSVLISHGGTEMGQGLHTKMIQVAARALGIPPDNIHIAETSSSCVSNAPPTVASSGSDVNGMAVLNACQILNERLASLKKNYPDGDWSLWIEKAYYERICLQAIGHYLTPEVGYNFETNTGHPYTYFTVGVGCSVVEIDCLTGDHKVLRTDIVMDLGSSLNPAIDIGQIEGAFMQGYGLFTMEELIFSPNGTLYSKGPGMYKIPTFSDIPTEFNISLLTGAPNPRAVYSSKAVGEPPLFLAASVFFALKEAISSARLERGLSPHFELISPATSARIRMACEDQFTDAIQIIETDPDPECTLLSYLRLNLRLTGSKLGCGEGGCGACTVMLSKVNRNTRKVTHLAVNACLMPLCAVHGTAITTVEGIGSVQTRLHPVQERIAKAHGSQCGFCTPGIVMSMYALLRNLPKPTMKDLEVAFQGNLCRCTGYRPIIEGYRTFTKEYECAMGANCCKLNGNSCNSSVDDKLFEPNDFAPYHPSQEPIFPPELQLNDKLDETSLEFRGPRVTWFRPTQLDELLRLKAKYPTAKIVVGNSEVGVEMKLKNFLYPVLIQTSHIQEMSRIDIQAEGVKIGASVSLSEVEEFLLHQIQTEPSYKTRIYKQVVDMLKYFAGKQIRNVASFGGNIMTANPISDLNPLLMAAEVEIEVMSLKRGLRKVKMDTKFFTGYRKNLVQPDEVVTSLLLPKTKKYQFFVAYKQAKRRDDDIAIVNIAMNVHFLPNTDIIDDIHIAYGGMGPTTLMARKTCKGLRELHWNESLMESATMLLSEELTLPYNTRRRNVSYRNCLSLSLFFKGYLAIAQELESIILTDGNIKATARSGASGLQTSAPKSSQLFERPLSSQPDVDPIGRPIVATSAYKQASGEAVYCNDMPRLDNELYLAFVFSRKSYAKILSVDETDALRLEGVHAFFSAKDLAPERNRLTGFFADEHIFADGQVLCKGQIIGAIAADNQSLAQRAARLVKVEYEDLSPVIITIEDAIKHKSFYPQAYNKIEKGDVEEAFRTSDHVIEGTVRMGGQEHFYLETQTSLAIPRDCDELEIYSACQHITHLQEEISEVLEIPQSKIYAKAKRLGGGFGGKEDRSFLVSLPVAIAAYKLKRPVRCMLDRNEDILITGTRHPYLLKYKVGCTRDGLITALDIECYSNGGHSIDVSWLVIRKTLLQVDNAYYIPNVRAQGWVCKTNIPSSTAFRGFGGPQGCFAAEHYMREIARVTGKDYTEIALLNMYKDGDLTHYNMVIENCTLKRSWAECIRNSQYYLQLENIRKFNQMSRYKKRGIAMVPIKHGITNHPVLGKASALIHIYQDASVLLAHGGIEMGQGLYTKMVQVASRVLRIPHELIHTSQTSTDTTANLVGTAGSLGSDLNGMAVLDACNKINERLKPIKEKYPDKDWKFWITQALNERVCLSASGYYKTDDDTGYNWQTNTGTPSLYFTTGVGCSIVEIDCLTGDHQVLKTDIVMDIGSSLNPAIDIGQIEGAFIQGYGLFTLEEMIYSPDGDIYSLGPGAYKIPAFSNIPTEFNVSILTGSKNPRAVFSSKAVGEPPLFSSASVFFAIKEAISAYRIQNGFSKHFELKSPATSARIRMACQDVFCKMVDKTKEEGDNHLESWNIMP